MSDKPAEEPVVIEGEVVDDPPPPAPVDYTDAGVPTFDYVRDRIENRAATAAGTTELADETPQATSLDEQLAERDRAGRERLEQIRRSMRGE
ncbi:MAG TPA: hypothetical protein VGX25_12120 [Actinophytocola sp.]|uniref:hypothetical protein n=1 Tax=Actinophytocola sp. TaxID=1872138 RepID=UPI002DDD604D|nr:hypothetical protein [Actinophytocola sp.]HEV2780129.1 hypothetical protein [Actinophytocola sp.]